MRVLRNTLACACLVAAVAASAASASTHVKVTSWHVYDRKGKLHKVKPGATLKSCASNPASELDAKGKVTGAKKGKAFKELWTVKGGTGPTFDESWSRNGSFTDYFSLSDEGGFDPGTWQVKLVQGGKAIGKSAITLKRKTGC